MVYMDTREYGSSAYLFLQFFLNFKLIANDMKIVEKKTHLKDN